MEIVLAIAVAAAAFVLAALASSAARSHVPALLLGLLFLAGVLAVARLGGVVYAVPVGLVTLQAFDWYFLPPLRDTDAETVFVVVASILISVLVAEIASGAGRRAEASEEARGLLADEQEALRRVATLVARQPSATELFAAVSEEVGRLLRLDIAQTLVYGDDHKATVVGSWSRLGEALPVGMRLTLAGDSAIGRVFRGQRPARIDDYADAHGSTAEYGRSFGIRAEVGAPVVVDGHVWGVITAGSLRRGPLPTGTESRMAEFTELVATALANAEARSDLERVAGEQAAVGRVATLVAQGAAPGRVFAHVAEEIGRALDAGSASIVRYEADGTGTVVAVSGDHADLPPGGSNGSLAGESVLARVFDTRRPARTGNHDEAVGERPAVLAAPILIEDRVWGAAVANARSGPWPEAAEKRIANFAGLIATAISNAETRTELAASRARVVTASDETRRRLERDLHDGIQQRLVSLALQARATANVAPERPTEIQGELSQIADDLGSALDELQEISRGIHPAILSKGGLGPAFQALARRSAVPIALDVNLDERLAESLELAVYYVASEAVTNAVKHAEASAIELHVDRRAGAVSLLVRDDGIGGADPSQGSGLIGLTDRVESLGGRISVVSPSGDGTTVSVQFPVNPSPAAAPPAMEQSPELR